MIEQIKEKIEKLRGLGKDESELELWLKMLPLTNDEEQKKLLVSLEREITFLASK